MIFVQELYDVFYAGDLHFKVLTSQETFIKVVWATALGQFP